MANKLNNYKNGRAREYSIMNKLKADGKIVLRQAGSHGFCDLVSIDPVTRIINFIQVKPKSMSDNAKTALQSKISWVDGNWRAKAHVISLAGEIR